MVYKSLYIIGLTVLGLSFGLNVPSQAQKTKDKWKCSSVMEHLSKLDFNNNCQSVSCQNDKLKAHCKTTNGSLAISTLELKKCNRNQKIKNCNGVLTCGKCLPSSEHWTCRTIALKRSKLPFNKNCDSVSCQDDQLKAKCDNEDGSYPTSYLDLKKCKQKHDISNCSGTLKCGKCVHDSANWTCGFVMKNRSSFGFNKSCGSVSCQHGTLKAKCNNTTGKKSTSYLELKSCHPLHPDEKQNIVNCKGALKCDKC